MEELARILTRRIDKEGRIMKRNWIRYHCAQKKKSSNENINQKVPEIQVQNIMD